MADSATGFDRSIESTSYSPPVSGDRVLADRPQRSSTTPSEERDGNAHDLASLIKLGGLKLEIGDDAAATEFFRKALEMGDRTLGPDHPDLILLLNDLTRLYLKQSAHAAAEPLLLRLLDMKRSKGEDHPEVATVLASLAAVRQALGRHESSEQLCRRVLDIRERTLAPNHFAIATALEHLGDVCAARGNIAEALTALQRALTIRERTLGSSHPSLRTSRERIADLQLQASENSVEPTPDIPTAPAPERYRLLSGEPMALTTPTPRAREKAAPAHPSAAPAARQTKVRIQHGFSDVPPTVEDKPVKPIVEDKILRPIVEDKVLRPIVGDTLVSKEPVVAPADVLRSTVVAYSDETAVPPRSNESAAPYREALESIRDELESPYDVTPSLAERSGLIMESVIEFLGRKQVIAGIVIVVLGLLSLAVARDSHAGAEVDLTASVSTPASRDASPVNVAAKNAVTPPATPTRESANPAGSTGAAATAPKSTAAKPRVVEEKDPPKKAEAKTESKKISIPTLSSGVMSRLDSVAARAADASSRAGDPLAIQPSLTNIGNHRSSFDYTEQSNAPQRARLIGELPTPRLPDRMAAVEGEVQVRFNVDTDGVPVMSTFTVVNSPSPVLTVAVRKVIPGMRFEPARSGGADAKPIVDVVQIGFQFSRSQR
jgi:tetratricopeptide (TPR) repeat protein